MRKNILYKLLSIIAMATITAGHSYGQDPQTEGTKTLVVYFSYSGNTQAVANNIHVLTGADIFRIETIDAYPAEYRRCTEVAREELDNNARPEIKGAVEDIGRYDTVFIGYPIWWGTYPMGVATFLDGHDLTGKTVIPFCTHEGSRQGRSFDDLAKAAPGATHSDGLVLRGSQAPSSRSDVEAWLRRLSIIK